MNVPIIFSNNFSEFQALMQELKRQRMIMTAFMEEMKQQYQSILKNLKKMGQPRQKVASNPNRKFSNKLEGQHSKNLQETGEFHLSPMQVEVRYISSHMREDGTLENIAEERPNAAMATAC